MDYATDARQVHQIIKSLVQGESGENWIKHIDSNNDGRQDFFTLRNFYHGQGNANRRIQEADRLLRELFYKGAEKTFSWERYVKEFKRMCDIYEEEGQPLHDKLKTRSFLERIQVPSLQFRRMPPLPTFRCLLHLLTQLVPLPRLPLPTRLAGAALSRVTTDGLPTLAALPYIYGS
jgi:hypothetical protein